MADFHIHVAGVDRCWSFQNLASCVVPASFPMGSESTHQDLFPQQDWWQYSPKLVNVIKSTSSKQLGVPEISAPDGTSSPKLAARQVERPQTTPAMSRMANAQLSLSTEGQSTQGEACLQCSTP